MSVAPGLLLCEANSNPGLQSARLRKHRETHWVHLQSLKTASFKFSPGYTLKELTHCCHRG